MRGGGGEGEGTEERGAEGEGEEEDKRRDMIRHYFLNTYGRKYWKFHKVKTHQRGHNKLN